MDPEAYKIWKAEQKRKKKAMAPIYKAKDLEMKLAKEASAQMLAAQIVQAQAPQNSQLISPVYQMASPSAMVAQGMEDYGSLDILEAIENIPEIAQTATQEAQLIVPPNLPATLEIDSTGRIQGTTIIPTQYTEASGYKRPATISNETYLSRKKGRSSAFSFIPRSANIPFDAYLHKESWYHLPNGDWAFEPNQALHPENIAYEKALAEEKQQAGARKSDKELQQIVRRRFGDKKRKERQATAGASGDWSQKRGEALYVRSHLKPSDFVFDARKMGDVEPYMPTSSPPSSPEIILSRPRPNRPLGIMEQIRHRPRLANQVVASLNPTGLEIGPSGSRNAEYPVLRLAGMPIRPIDLDVTGRQAERLLRANIQTMSSQELEAYNAELENYWGIH